MSSITISPASIDLRNEERMRSQAIDISKEARLPVPTTTDLASEHAACDHEWDQLHFFWKSFDDKVRMGDAFTAFSETLVPLLAGIGIERPSVIAQDFDLRYDDGRLKVIDTEMAPDDLEWLEARLNSHPNLSRLAHLFNIAVLGAYGDGEQAAYFMRSGNAFVSHESIPGLADSVDRDVKFMSLLRTVRDADCGNGAMGAYFEEHRYDLAATKVLDYITSPDTYRRMASGDLVLMSPPKSSIAKWKA